MKKAEVIPMSLGDAYQHADRAIDGLRAMEVPDGSAPVQSASLAFMRRISELERDAALGREIADRLLPVMEAMRPLVNTLEMLKSAKESKVPVPALRDDTYLLDQLRQIEHEVNRLGITLHYRDDGSFASASKQGAPF